MFNFIHLVQKWLQPESLPGLQIVECVVIDSYRRSLPIPLQKWVSQGDSKSANNLVELIEMYFAAESLVTISTASQTFHPKPWSPQATGKTVPGQVGDKHGKETVERSKT